MCFSYKYRTYQSYQPYKNRNQLLRHCRRKQGQLWRDGSECALKAESDHGTIWKNSDDCKLSFCLLKQHLSFATHRGQQRTFCKDFNSLTFSAH